MVMNQLKQRYMKRFFDPKNKADLMLYKNFIKTRSWGADGCPFELEWPWLSVPDMLAHKISEFAVEQV